ncbi:MAG: gliding motility-associated C-terminal domain-containing protein [Saprospiraceae bacterium]|nr:gliding motility-associated C-terminal domain-containing protein [Saprospiraceae bacterium]
MQKWTFLALLLFFLLPSPPLQAQLDSVHWIPPFHARDTRGQQYLYLTTPEPIPFSVTISTGTGGAIVDGTGATLSTITLSNSSPQRIYIGNGDAFPVDNLVTLTRVNQLHQPLNDKGIKLSASKPFYANFRSRTTDQAGSLTAKGSAALGTSFRIGHVFNSVVSGYNTGNRSNFFSVMATQPNTVINVSGFTEGIGLETSAGLVYPSVSYQVTLQAGQCYVASAYVDQNKPIENENGLMGSLVESTQPIVVNCGTWLGSPFNYNYKDIGIDQIVPVDQVGKEYVTIRGDGHVGLETPIVIATEDSTEVYLNGNPVPYALLDAGEYIRIPESNYTAAENLYIRATHPVYTYQMLGGANFEPTGGLNFVPPLRCSDESSINHIMDINKIGNTTYEGKLLILAEAGKTVQLNGVPLNPLVFQPVTGNPGYVTYKAPNLTGNIRVDSDGALQIGVFGRNNYAGWAGYFSGFDKVIRPKIAITINSTCGDTLLLENLENTDSVVWHMNNIPLLQTSDSILTGVKPGTYFAVAYREFCGEFLWDTSLQIVIPEPMDLVSQASPVTCPEIPAGSFQITSISGGFQPYEISYDAGLTFSSTFGLDSLWAGSYPVVIRDSLGCIFQDTIQVASVPDVPIVSLQPPPPLTCLDTTQIIGITGTSQGSIYSGTWWSPTGTMTADLTQGLQVSQPGQYILQLTQTLNQCVRADTVMVLADQIPPSVLIEPVSKLTCIDTTIAIQAQATNGNSLQFSWTSPTGSILTDPAQPSIVIDQGGQYQLLVTNPVNGCTTFVVTDVEVDQTPPITTISDPETLTCLLTSQWIHTQLPSPSEWSLAWVDASGEPLVSGVDSLFVQTPGTYALLVTNSTNGCTTEEKVEVMQDVTVPVVDAGPLTQLTCHDTISTLSGSLSNCTGCTTNWVHTAGSLILQPGQLQIITTQEGWYQLTAVNPMNGCEAMDSVEVIRIPAPEKMSILAIPPNCQDPSGALAFGPVVGGVLPYQYSFDGGKTYGNQTTLDPAPASSYTLMIKDATGCILQQDTSMIAYTLPVLVLDVSVELAYGESVPILATVNIPAKDILSIEWTPGTGLNCVDCLNPVASPLETTTYQLTVIDKNGCEVKATIRIDVALEVDVFIPNVFHPDGNGINDGFTAFADPEKVIRIVELRIYDRWGNAVFRTTDIPVNQTIWGWDGTYRSEPMDPAVFVYVVEVEFINGQRGLFKGDVQLSR